MKTSRHLKGTERKMNTKKNRKQTEEITQNVDTSFSEATTKKIQRGPIQARSAISKFKTKAKTNTKKIHKNRTQREALKSRTGFQLGNGQQCLKTTPSNLLTTS